MFIRHEKDNGIIFDTEVGQVLGLWDIDAILPIPNHVDEFGFGWEDQELTRPYNAITALTKCGSVDEFQGMDPLDFDFGLE